jgi:hypothetical protein
MAQRIPARDLSECSDKNVTKAHLIGRDFGKKLAVIRAANDMKQAFLPLYIAVALCLFTAAGKSSTVNWKNGSSGNWSDPANWHPAQVPGPSDTAVINAKGTYTVTLDTNASVGGLQLGANDANTQTLKLSTNTLTLGGQMMITNGGFIDLSSGTLFGATNAVLTGTFTCFGATLAGVLTLATNSVINLYASGPSNVFSGLTVFTNYGTINWSNTDLACPAPLICNYGLWDAKANNTFHGSTGGASAFNNYGTFRKDGGNGTTLLDTNTVFHNSGILDIEIGGVTLSSGNGGGQFNTATNAGFSLGNFTLTGDATFTGPGPAQGNLLGSNGIIHGGLNLANGSLSGTLTVASNSIANLVAAPSMPGLIDFNLLTITNFGTVNWRGLGLAESNSVIDNFGLWNAQDNSHMYGAFGVGVLVFNNYGTFRKSGGTLTGGPDDYTWIDWNTTFNNFGTVDTEVGLLQPYTPFNCSSGSVINTASNAINNLGLNVSGDIYFTGAGKFDGGLTGSNGVIHGVVPSTEITLAGTLTLASNSVLYLAAVPQQTVSFDAATFTNYGTVICTSDHLGGDGSPQIYNYGLWDMPTGTYFLGANGGGGGTTTFNNYGTFRADGGATFDSNTTFNNSGLVDVQALALEGSYSLAGGTLNFGIQGPNGYGSLNLIGSGQLAGSLSVNFTNYSPVVSDSYVLVNYVSQNGTFTSLNLPHLAPPLSWLPSYGGSSLSLNVVSTTPQLSAAATVNGNGISLTWDGLLGQTYQVQSTTNLAPAVWINLGSSIPGTNGAITVSDSLTNCSQKFYRIELQ